MLTTFTGRVGDHNDRGMRGAALLGGHIAARWGLAGTVLGKPEPALNTDWRTELAAARRPLTELRAALDAAPGNRLTVLPRCAGALATVPAVAAGTPEIRVLWFDAHADVHLPETTDSGYLGGMALSGPLGWWDTGHGAGLRDAVLAGARDIDPAEQRLIAERGLPSLPVGPGFAERVAAAAAGRPVYVHLDCDVLEPGTTPTDYRVPGGLGLAELHAVATALVAADVRGLEIAEFEDTPDGEPDPDPGALLDALAPLIDALIT